MLMPTVWRNGNLCDVMDPFGTMSAWDRMWDSFWGDEKVDRLPAMKTDVFEDEKDYRLEAELPGFNKEDIHLEVKDNVLTITAKHEENTDEKDDNGKCIRKERRSSSYQRSFSVEGLEPEDIMAQYRNGVLTVTVPKKEVLPQKEEAKQIAIAD